MKKLFALAAFAAAFGVFADGYSSVSDFENPDEGAAVTGVMPVVLGSLWDYATTDGISDTSGTCPDGSRVKAYGGESGLAKPDDKEVGGQYLELSTEGGTVWRGFNEKSGNDFVPQSIGDGLYIDTLVQFTPMEDAGSVNMPSDGKLAIWLNVDSNNNTNLMVRGGFYGTEDELGELGYTQGEARDYKLVKASDGNALEINPDTWYRLTVKAVAVEVPAYYGFTGFTVSLDNVELKADIAPITSAFMDEVADYAVVEAGQEYEAFAAKFSSLIAVNRIIPSIGESLELGSEQSLSAIGFQGSGAIDNLTLTDADPLNQGGGEDTGIAKDLPDIEGLGTAVANLDSTAKTAIETDWAAFKDGQNLKGKHDIAHRNFLLGVENQNAVEEGYELVAEITMGANGPEVTLKRKNPDGSIEEGELPVKPYVKRQIKWSTEVTFPDNAAKTGLIDADADIPGDAKFFRAIISIGTSSAATQE